MSEITISLRFNRKSGKKDIVIGYESDADALPLEHEQNHRAIVAQLLSTGMVAPGDVGNVVMERVGKTETNIPSGQTREGLRHRT